MRRTLKRDRSALVIALALTGLLAGFTAVARATEPFPGPPSVRTEMIRLHVLAHSDAPADQAVKSPVRDAAAAVLAEAVRGAPTAAAARERVRENLGAVERAARDALRAAGHERPVRVEFGRFPFPDQSVAGLVAPAGEYDAVRVIIGAGAGHNIWCVFFPPLCVVDGRPGYVLWRDAPREDVSGFAAIDAEGRVVLDLRQVAGAPPAIRFALLDWLRQRRRGDLWATVDRFFNR